MAYTPERDWSYNHNPSEGADIEYATFDKTVGRLAHRLLGVLSQEITGPEDRHGLTEADRSALGLVKEIDGLSDLLVPPDTTPLDNRIAYREEMAAFREAFAACRGRTKMAFWRLR